MKIKLRALALFTVMATSAIGPAKAVVFFDGKDWWPPHLPLLKGTCRARLLHQKIIKEAPLGVDDLKKFQGLKLINALRDMDQAIIPINALVY